MSLNWLLRIPNFLTRYSKVEGGTWSLAAAPFGPDTRPRLPASASSMICRSRLASSSASVGSGCCGKLTRPESLGNQAASTQNTPSELTMTDRSTTFCNSHISRPGVLNERIHRCLRYLLDPLPHAPGKKFDKMRDQRRNILPALAQWW